MMVEFRRLSTGISSPLWSTSLITLLTTPLKADGMILRADKMGPYRVASSTRKCHAFLVLAHSWLTNTDPVTTPTETQCSLSDPLVCLCCCGHLREEEEAAYHRTCSMHTINSCAQP